MGLPTQTTFGGSDPSQLTLSSPPNPPMRSPVLGSRMECLSGSAWELNPGAGRWRRTFFRLCEAGLSRRPRGPADSVGVLPARGPLSLPSPNKQGACSSHPSLQAPAVSRGRSLDLLPLRALCVHGTASARKHVVGNFRPRPSQGLLSSTGASEELRSRAHMLRPSQTHASARAHKRS